MISLRRGSCQIREIFTKEDGEKATEPGKIAQKLLDTIVKSILKAKSFDAADPSTGYHELMNVSDYHILYNYFKTRLDIAAFENENLESIVGILYERGKDLILDANGVTNGRIKILDRTMLHDVIGYHRDRFHEENSPFDCGCLLVKMLISYNADVNARDKYGSTPFHEAAANHCEQTMKMLLNTGRIDPKQTDSEDESALFYLVENIVDNRTTEELRKSDLVVKRLDSCLRLLLEHGLDFKRLGKNQDSAFHRILQNFYVSLPLVINFVEMCSPDVLLKNKFGFTPLHVCVKSGSKHFDRERTDILRYLCILSSKEALNSQDIATKTPLVHALVNENKTFCRVLFSNGASIECPDKHGLSPLHYACMCSNSSLVDVLLDCGVDINSKDYVGDKPIVYAAAHGKFDLVKMLYPFYKKSKELHNRLLTVADFNGHRECHENLKMMKEWDIIELNAKQTKKVRRVEVELREVDAWLREKRDYLRKHRRMYFISPVEKFYILHSLREYENQEMCNAITELLKRVSERISKDHSIFKFKPVLAGSMAEETKLGKINSLEFHCEMHELSKTLDLTKVYQVNDDNATGFVQLRVSDCQSLKQTPKIEKLLQSQGNQTTYLSSFNIIREFLRAVTDSLCNERMWRDLHLSWDYSRAEQQEHTSDIHLFWVGKNYKYKHITVHLVPVVFTKECERLPSHVEKLLSTLDEVAKKTTEMARFTAQNVKCFDVDQPDLLWKVNYTPLEQIIFRLLPENILEGYKLSKLVRSEHICPHIFTLSYFPKLSMKATEYLSTELLKTCLFYELSSRLEIGGMEYLRQTDSVGWALNILNRVETFLERTSAVPSFFDETINLKDERVAEVILAISKIGKSWLQHQWEDLYGGRKPPVEKRFTLTDVSSPEL